MGDRKHVAAVSHFQRSAGDRGNRTFAINRGIHHLVVATVQQRDRQLQPVIAAYDGGKVLVSACQLNHGGIYRDWSIAKRTAAAFCEIGRDGIRRKDLAPA